MTKNFKEGNTSKVKIDAQTTDKHAVSLAQDVHTLDLYRKIFCLGFFPLTYNERRALGFSELICWGMPPYSDIRLEMYYTYKTSLSQAIHETGEVHFGNYMRGFIETNDNLTNDQKEFLLDRFIGMSDDGWNSNEIIWKFHRLSLFMLGIIRKKPIYEEPWVIVVDEKEKTNEVVNEEFADWTVV